jgi:FkbM family methyltransferase
MRRVLNHVLASTRCFDAYQRLKAVRGVGPLVRWASRWAFPPNRTRWVEVRRGMGQSLNLLVLPQYELAYIRGDHEPSIQNLMTSVLRQGDVFFDVGAHIGFFSLIAGRVVGSTGSVVAIEPDPGNFVRLTANIARNGMNWVKPIHAVALDRHGKAPFMRSAPASSGMEGRVVSEGSATAVGDLRVDCLMLDDHFSHRRGAVKVDVEGAELLVLKGAPRLLAEGQLTWIVEAHSAELEAAISQMFRDAGYTCHRISALRSPSRTNMAGRYVIAESKAQNNGLPLSEP